MVQSQRHLGDATVDVAKPLRRQAKRACVVHRETTQAKTQKPKKSHPRNSGGSRRRREAVKAEKHPSVDEPSPDVSNYLSTRAATWSIGVVPAARLPSQDIALLTSFFPKRDDDVPVSPPPAEHSADNQILYATPSPSLASTPTEEPKRDWYLPVPEYDEPRNSEVHMHQRKA